MKKILIITFSAFLLVAGCANQTSKQTSLSTEKNQSTSSTPTTTYPSLPAPQSKFNTSKWKTYTNTVYGFTVKYPTNWHIISDNSTWETDFSPIGETYYLEGGSPPAGVIRIGASPDVKFDESKYNIKGIMPIAGKIAYKSINDYYQEVSIYFNVNGIPLIFTNDVKTEGLSGSKADQYNAIFDTMLTTIKF